MQLDLPFLRAPAPPTEAAPFVRADAFVHVVRTRRARRYILRVRPDGSVRVTVPRGGSRAEALRFLDKQAAWIARERERVRATHAAPRWCDGTTVLFRGVAVTVRVVGDGDDRRASYGDRVVPLGDAPVDVRAAIEDDLRAVAREELVPRLHRLAAQHGLDVAGVTIRDQKSRWGSCSKAGRIALNFRLVQMPPAICDYVLLHELMHLRQQNHSRRFWRLVERACPDFRAAERWLRTTGRTLF